MIKVLLLLENSPFATGGIERHCKAIMELFNNSSSISIDYLCKDNIKHHYNKVLRKFVFDTKSLHNFIKSYDVIHVHGFASFVAIQGLSVAQSQKKTIIYTAHYHPFDKLRRPLLGKLFFNFFLRKKMSRIDTIIAINNEDKLFFERFNSNIAIVPNWLTGIDNIECARQKNMLLAVGRNDENKGFFHLNHIDFDKFDVHCVTISGEGLDKRITIHSGISDQQLAKLYSKAALVVVPSKYEAFSYVALEALERGTPILISQNVRIADHLDDISGVSIFEFGNTADFNAKIELTVGAKVDVCQIKTKFGCDKIKSDFEQIYKCK